MQLNSEGLITLERSAQLKPYKPRQFPEREYLTDAELLANVGGTLFVNVESYPNYFLITFKLHKTNKFLQLECSDTMNSGKCRSFNPKFLSWVMQSYRTVGFNSLNYDFMMIWLAYTTQDVAILKDATNDLIVYNMRLQELKKKYNFFTFKTNHIDLIEVAPLGGSLKLYGARLHVQSIQDQPFPIDQDLSEFEIEQLKGFNCNQLDITETLFDFMKERLELRGAMSLEYREDLMSKSDAQMAEAVLSKEIGKLNGKRLERPDIPAGSSYYYKCPDFISFATPVMQNFLEVCKKAKFVINNSGYLDAPKEIDTSLKIGNMEYSFGIGGLHSKEKCVSYKASKTHKLTDRDVRSYYPACILNLGLYPIAAGPNFLEVFRGFRDSRVEAKLSKNFTKDKGLKIFLNGTSGKFSDLWSKLRSPNLTMQMNLTCQLSILMLIEMLHCNGLQVISANTDGITIYHTREDQGKLDYWIKYWENLTGFDTEETEYGSYHARDVGAYFATKLVTTIDGLDKKFASETEARKYASDNALTVFNTSTKIDSIKVKGPYSEVGSQSGTQLDTNPIVLVCTDAVEALLSKGTPIEQTILGCKDFTRFITVRQAKAPGAHKDGEYLGKVIRWAYMKGETGCIQTVATNNKVAGSDGARAYMDLPTTFPDDINYDWYINKTKEILEDIGHTPKPKQLQFF